MTKNNPTPTDKLTYALHLIDKLPQALLHHVAPLDDILYHLGQLNGRTCTGNPHWRDKNASGKTAKLYILHRTNETCPVHGQPEPGCRHRVYVGNKPDRIADALAAIERHAELCQLQRQHNNLQGTIGRLTYQINALYRILGHYPPEPGQDPQPIPPYRP